MDIDELIERAHRGEAEEAELASLTGWRAASEANERHYRDVVRILEATGALRAELTASPAPASYAELLARKSSFRMPAPAAGRAARHAGSRWRGGIPWAVAAAALVLLLVNTFRQPGAAPEAVLRHAEIVTGAGEIATVQLGDGSVVRLAPDSRLRIGGDADERIVSLDGRAFFSVAPMRGRPFSVTTAAGTARVLGTRFDLRAAAGELELVVVEGRVALEAPQNRVIVTAGQGSVVTDGVAAAPNPVDGAHLTRWAGRFLAFQNTPLREAMREIAAMYDVRITITDPALREQTVTAVFTGQELDAVLAVVCEVVNARCARNDTDVTVSPR